MSYIFPPELCERRSFGNLATSNAQTFRARGQHLETAIDVSEIAFTIQRELSSLRELSEIFTTTLTTTDALNILNDSLQRLLSVTSRHDALRRHALELFAEISALLLENAATREHISELASNDALTGLQNMRAFRSTLIQRLAARAHDRTPFAVLYLNIDNFAALNRREGHAHGDIVLRELAALLKGNLPHAYAIARAHDDVFLVLLQDSSRDLALTNADDLQAALETHIFNFDDERQANVTVSIGIASCPDDGETLDKLLARAAHHSHKKHDKRNQPSTSFPFSIKPIPNVIPFAPRLNPFN